MFNELFTIGSSIWYNEKRCDWDAAITFDTISLVTRSVLHLMWISAIFLRFFLARNCDFISLGKKELRNCYVACNTIVCICAECLNPKLVLSTNRVQDRHTDYIKPSAYFTSGRRPGCCTGTWEWQIIWRQCASASLKISSEICLLLRKPNINININIGNIFK